MRNLSSLGFRGKITRTGTAISSYVGRYGEALSRRPECDERPERHVAEAPPRVAHAQKTLQLRPGHHDRELL